MNDEGKRATSSKRLDQLLEKSIREMQSISGQDLINRMLVFDARLRALINDQLVPPALIIGALMDNVYRLQSMGTVTTIDDLFGRVIGHVNRNFVTKEQFNILLKMLEDIIEKLEEKPFKAKVE